jgi:uncharacterized protein (TIGR03437 family)
MAFGAGFAGTIESANTIPLPESLAGTTIRIKDTTGTDHRAQLYLMAPAQANYIVPPSSALGPGLVTVTRSDGTASFGVIQIATVAPGLISANSNGQGVAAGWALRVKGDGSRSFELLAELNPTQGRFVSLPIDLGPETDQLYLSLCGTGFRFRTSPDAATVTIGGTQAPVLYVGPQGGFPGMDQVNVRLPRNLIGRGEMDVVLTVDGKASNGVKIAVR